MRLAIVVAASAAALSTTAVGATQQNPALPPAPPTGTGLPNDQCIRSQDIRNHTVADSRTLLLNANNKAYRLTMRGACLAGATSSDPIVTRLPSGQSRVCKPMDLDISLARSSFSNPCIVDSIVQLTPAEMAALPRRLRP